ncbi:715_t:CDS:2 [Dentiscutata erythropus]|uniref:715_t:CDS:1 n=1 Tax=Dentiscutata erythropus TaxID=1348616 RepID=A0A9N9CVI6_9GLOM|nr:715_t:CDS:2 [Dentiscutata erythropus]
MSDNITLICLVHGDRKDKAFVVEIEKNKPFYFIKKKIKEKKPNTFADVDAKDIVLWKVNVPYNDDTMEVDIVLEDNEQTGVQKLLNPIKKISNIFTVNLADNSIHIIVERPSNNPETQEIADLRFALFNSETGNAKKSTSVYRYVRKNGIKALWKFENDIEPLKWVGSQIFKQYPRARIKGSNEITEYQPFCKNVLREILQHLKLHDELLIIGDDGNRKDDEIYADLIIGLREFYQQLTNNPLDLSKGLGWKIKNDLTDEKKLIEGKGRLIKFARIYLTADVPLSQFFYGCLTDGNLWKFIRISFVNNFKDKMSLEESEMYEWNDNTASLIAGLISKYYHQYLSDGKKESLNNDNTINKARKSYTAESLLASFIKEGYRIRLSSGNWINVQVISHLGTGRDSIVFFAQICDYGIVDVVLKIEVRDLSCVPKILFEGHTEGGSWAIITDFLGQPLETWISDNGGIDDCTLFQILLDLLLCLEQIHTCGYAHGDVAIRNVIRRNEHFYLIDYGLAIMLQLLFDPLSELIRDYIRLCQIIGIVKFGEKMSLSELTNRLDGELKQFVTSVNDANSWEIDDDIKWLEKFKAKVQQFHEKGVTGYNREKSIE